MAFTEGRLRDDFEDPVNGDKRQMVDWHWLLFQADGVTPVLHEGNQVEFVAETSDRTGRRSTAEVWFSAHLKRKFDSRTDNVDETMEECIGKRVMLILTDKENGYKRTDVFQSGV